MSELRQIEEIAQIKQGRYTSPNELSERPTEHSKVPVWGANGILGYTQNATYEEAQPLVTCRGNGCGLIQWSGGRAHISNNAMAIVLPSQSQQSSKYLYYSLLNTDFTDVTTGSAQPQITMGHLNKKEIFWHSNPEERTAIAHILGTLDDKIELNRKTNETLEAMAKALFKSWFVDFDPVRAKAEGRSTGLPVEISDLFPDSFEDSELSEIPSGWAIRSVSEITERVAMGPFGSNIKVSTFVESGVPVISGAHLKGVLLQDADYRFVTEEHSLRLANSCVSSGDVVFTHAGTIGQVALIPENSEYTKYVLSQRQFYARPLRRSLRHYLLMFFHSEKGRHELLSNTSQTGVPSIARPATFLKSIRMPLPGEDLLILFDQIMSDLVTRMRSITGNTSNYVSIRDALLPKLISGEIRIPYAEKMLEEVDI